MIILIIILAIFYWLVCLGYTLACIPEFDWDATTVFLVLVTILMSFTITPLILPIIIGTSLAKFNNWYLG